MLNQNLFATSCEQIAQKLGLTLQEVRWAEQSALRKMKKHPGLLEAMKQILATETYEACNIEIPTGRNEAHNAE